MAAPNPKLVITPVTHDFGRIDQGAAGLGAVFQLKNVGEVDLRIVDVERITGLSSRLSREIVPPGQWAELAVELDSVPETGRVFKRITISTNEVDRPKTHCLLRADVVPEVMVEPRALFLTLESGNVCSERVRFSTRILDELRVEVKALHFAAGDATFRVTKIDDRTSDVHLELDGSRLDPTESHAHGALIVTTNGWIRKSIVVPIRGRVEVGPGLQGSS